MSTTGTWTTSRPSCANSGRPWPESGRSWSGCSGRSTPAWSSWRRPATASWTTSVWWMEAAPCRIVWVGGALTIRDYHDMELPVSRLSRDEEEAVVFLGKVGLGLSVQALERGEFDRYDGIFLVLDRADRFAGETVDLPGGRCAQVRFRGSHREAPAQYRRLMDFLAGEGLRPAGFAREITMIDYGVTDDPSQFVTEITVPIE